MTFLLFLYSSLGFDLFLPSLLLSFFFSSSFSSINHSLLSIILFDLFLPLPFLNSPSFPPSFPLLDALFFNQSREFLQVIHNGRANASSDVILHHPFTSATPAYAPGCVDKLNATIHEVDDPSEPFAGIFLQEYDDLTCLMGFKCEEVFRANPEFAAGNPNGTFFAAIERAEFWAIIDNQTQSDCAFAVLSQQSSIEDLIRQYEIATLACFAFLILSVVLSVWTAIHNFLNFHRKRLATFYDFIKYVVEDMSQLCIQIFIFSYQIGIRCWLCTTENGCAGPCNGRPSSVNEIASTSSFAELDTSINESLVLLSLTAAGMFLNAIIIIFMNIYNVRKHFRYLLLALALSPLVLLGLLTPLTWALHYALLPILEVHNVVAQQVSLGAAIAGSVAFPFVFIGMFYHFFHHSKHDNRLRRGTQATQISTLGVIEMTPKASVVY